MATSIRLDDALAARLAGLAKSRQRSLNSVAREAIQQYVEREEARLSFFGEADQSWAGQREADLLKGHGSGVRAPDTSASAAPARTSSQPAAAPYAVFMALAGAGSRLVRPLSKAEIDAHIRWLRDDD